MARTTKGKVRDFVKQAASHLVLASGCGIFLFPFVWMLSTSLKPDQEIFVYPPIIIPRPILWENYPKMWNYLPFFSFLRNTMYVTSMVLIGTILSCSVVAYGFSRLRWPGRDVVFIMVLATMMLPFQVTMIPLYLIFKQLNWINTFKPLWIGSFFAVNGFFVFLLRQFYLTIPLELEDAAKIDGCGYFGIYWRIMLPLIKPALATVAIFSFMWTWNDFIGPLIYINSVDKMTLALGLRLFQTTYSAEWALMMSAATVMTLPVLTLFFVAQKYFIQGITLTGMKG